MSAELSTYRPIWGTTLLAAVLAAALMLGFPNPAPAAIGPTGGFGPTGGTSPCRVVADAFASPTLVEVADYVNIRYQLHFRCKEDLQPLHFVLAVDGDAIAAKTPGAWAAREVQRLDTVLDQTHNSLVRAGLVDFGSQANTCDLTPNPAAFSACLDRLPVPPESDGETEADPGSLAGGIRSATALLLDARENLPPPPGAHRQRETLLVVTESPETADCPAGATCGAPETCESAAAAADEARSHGFDVAVTCVAGNCARSCLRHMASAGSYYERVNWSRAVERFSRQAWATERRIASVTVRDILASNMEIDPITVDPPDRYTYRPGDKSLQWTDYDVRGQLQANFAYATTPSYPGRITVSAYGGGTFVDTVGSTGTFTLPPQQVAAAERVLRIFTPLTFGPSGPVTP